MKLKKGLKCKNCRLAQVSHTFIEVVPNELLFYCADGTVSTGFDCSPPTQRVGRSFLPKEIEALDAALTAVFSGRPVDYLRKNKDLLKVASRIKRTIIKLQERKRS